MKIGYKADQILLENEILSASTNHFLQKLPH